MGRVNGRRLRGHAAPEADWHAGFTVLELLIVIVIIGTLAAIAIPAYLHQRKGAQDAAEEVDLRNFVTALEGCFADNGFYPLEWGGAVNAAGLIQPNGSPPYLCKGTQIASPNSLIGYRSDQAGLHYIAYSLSLNGSGTGAEWCFDNTVGGSIKKEPAGYTPDVAGLTC